MYVVAVRPSNVVTRRSRVRPSWSTSSAVSPPPATVVVVSLPIAEVAVGDVLEAAVGAVGFPQPAEPVVAERGRHPVRVRGAEGHAEPGVRLDQGSMTGRVDRGGGIQLVGVVVLAGVGAAVPGVVGSGDRGDHAERAVPRGGGQLQRRVCSAPPP